LAVHPLRAGGADDVWRGAAFNMQTRPRRRAKKALPAPGQVNPAWVNKNGVHGKKEREFGASHLEYLPEEAEVRRGAGKSR